MEIAQTRLPAGCPQPCSWQTGGGLAAQRGSMHEPQRLAVSLKEVQKTCLAIDWCDRQACSVRPSDGQRPCGSGSSCRPAAAAEASRTSHRSGGKSAARRPHPACRRCCRRRPPHPRPALPTLAGRQQPATAPIQRGPARCSGPGCLWQQQQQQGPASSPLHPTRSLDSTVDDAAAGVAGPPRPLHPCAR